MSTETTAPAGRAKQIRDRLAEIAPYPETAEATNAQNLARWLAVRSAVINHQQLGASVPLSRSQIDLLTILFAASHALYALDDLNPDVGTLVAKEIRDAWDDGGGVGEWLWEHLGGTACTEIGPLADELAAMAKPAAGLLAHAETIQQALNWSLLQAHAEETRKPLFAATAALESELDREREAGW